MSRRPRIQTTDDAADDAAPTQRIGWDVFRSTAPPGEVTVSYASTAFPGSDLPGAAQIDELLSVHTDDVRFEAIEERLSALETEKAAVRTPLTSLAPSAYHLLKPLEVVIEPGDGGFVATLYDANISAAGENQTEAFGNLRDLVVAMWEMLEEAEEGELGPEPARQRAVLREYIAK